MEQQRISPADRQRFYTQFIALVATRSQYEQDSLLQRGAPVFQYRLATARGDVERIRRENPDQEQTRVGTFVVTDDLIAELVYDPAAMPAVRFVVSYPDGRLETVDSLVVGNTLFVPPQSRILESGTVCLPDRAEEYGSQRDLYEAVLAFIQSYVQLESASFAGMSALYVFLTWIYDRFSVVPYLRAIGHFGVGKSRYLQVIGALAYRAIHASGALTVAPIFRLIERYHGTLVVDEADFDQHSDLWGELIKVFNVGYQRGFKILRAERDGDGGEFDVKAYDCYGPKVLASRERYDDALESRCFTYRMAAPVDLRPDIPFHLDQEFYDRALGLRRRLLRWRLASYRQADLDPRYRIQGLDLRLNQIVLPLLAMTVEPEMRQMIIRYALEYQQELNLSRQESLEGVIAFRLLQRLQAAPALPSGSPQDPLRRILLRELLEVINRDFGTSRPMTSRRLANILRDQFQLTLRKEGGETWVFARASEQGSIGRRFHVDLPKARQAIRVVD